MSGWDRSGIMGAITADENVQAWLGQIKEKTEIRGQNGQLIGVFEPRSESDDPLYERAKRLFDPAEIERRMATEKDQGYTIEQVREHLRSLEAKQ
jgi:hypothetical protein